MLAPQNQTPTLFDSMQGNQTDWYNAVDEALRLSEIIPGEYEYSTATSYGQVDDINEGDSTYFDIKCDRFKIISLENSYLTMKQEIPITIPKQTDNIIKEYYGGFKFSPEIIDQYRIQSNTDLLFTSNNSRYEWFLMYNSISDAAKQNSDCFATIDKIRNKNPLVPGKYYNFSAITTDTVCKVKLDEIRIPLSFFLLLSNMKWHPSWAGTITIEILPSYKNFVFAPVVHESTIHTDSLWLDLLKKDHKVDLGFNNINSEMLNLVKKINTATSGTAVYEYQVETHKFTATSSITSNVKVRMAQYMLRMDVFNDLASKYVQVPLLFPAQIIEPKNFTEPIVANENEYRVATTVAVKHCDSMFIVFPKDRNSRTCFKNPSLQYSINLDGKYYPREPYNSIDDHRNFNLLFDALNINNNLLHSVPNDLRTSLQPYYTVNTFNASGNMTASYPFYGGDESNFMIGIPFADSEDFMGGISTNNTVQIEMSGVRTGQSDSMKKAGFEAPVGIYVQDVFLKIRAMKPEGRPQIEITSATVEQILGAVM